MINHADLLRLRLEQHLQHYIHAVGFTHNLKWEIRSEKQIVSSCFTLPEIPNIDVVINVLNQSELFEKVGIVQSRIYPDQLRILIKTDSVTNLIDRFQYAEYFNTLLRVLPVSGVLCAPSSENKQLTLQACAVKNSFGQVPKLLKLLALPWETLPSGKIVIHCKDVATLITQQKQQCLDYLVQSVQAIDSSIEMHGKEIKTESLSSSPHSVYMHFSDKLWLTTPALIFNYQKNPTTIETTLNMLASLHAGLLEFKISGYYDAADPLVPCGIRVNQVMNIPYILKDLARQSRNNYINTLLTFKGKNRDFGFPEVPYEISKKILQLTCDEASLLDDEDKNEYIDRINNLSL